MRFTFQVTPFLKCSLTIKIRTVRDDFALKPHCGRIGVRIGNGITCGGQGLINGVQRTSWWGRHNCRGRYRAVLGRGVHREA